MNAQGAAGILAGLFVCIVIVVVIAIVIHVLFLMTLFRTMKLVRQRNREMAPGMVFLNLIPLFSIVWSILMVGKIARSLEREFDDRQWRSDSENFGRTVGLIWAWGGVATLVISILQNIAQFANQAPVAMVLGLLNLPVSLAILVCFIMYWVQIYQYGTRLGDRGYASGSVKEHFDDLPRDRRDDEYDDDDRPRGRRHREDDDDDRRRRRDDF